MTRIAVITDVHANLPALDAVFAKIERLGVDSIYCGGDLVGYGPHPSEVCAAIEARAIPSIYGNYDYAIARDIHDCGCAYVTQHDREIGQLSVEWTLEHTDRRAKDFMRGLPFDIRFELGGELRGFKTSVHAAVRYSWMRPPRRSWRSIAPAPSGSVPSIASGG
jgi:Calcineurin-like phosphoesterase superfamily domain